MDTNNCDTFSVVSYVPYDASDDADIYASSYPKDSKDIKDVIKHYITTIRRISKEIGDLEPSSGSSLSQRPSTQSLLPLPAFDLSTLMQEKMRFLNALTTFFKENKPISFPRFRAEASLDILESFSKENEECKKTIESLETQLSHETEEHKRLQEQLQMLKEMENFNYVENDKQVEKDLKISFKECKNDLNALLELIIPGSDMKDVLTELIDMSEENEWYDGTKNENALPLLSELTRLGIVNEQSGYKYQLKI